MKLSLALAQINTKLGDVEANLDKHLALAHEAWKSGADLVLFPELSLTGYVLQDLAADAARRPTAQDPLFKKLLQASKNLDMVVGFVEEIRATGITSHRLIFQTGELPTSTEKFICRLTAFSTKNATSPPVTASAPLTPNSAAPGSSSAKISGMFHHPTPSGWTAPTCSG